MAEIDLTKYSPKLKNLIGRRFDRLVVVGFKGTDKAANALWECLCDCGGTKTCAGTNLISQRIRSCGCLMRESQVAHGARSRTDRFLSKATYKVWGSMKDRCSNPKHKYFHHYGGRGITVCERWMVYANFFSDMGIKPPGLSLDRINNDGNYEPSNCRWATMQQQGRNRRANHLLTHAGKTMCLAEWEAESGILQGTICDRLRCGWSDSDAVTRPVANKHRSPFARLSKANLARK